MTKYVYSIYDDDRYGCLGLGKIKEIIDGGFVIVQWEDYTETIEVLEKLRKMNNAELRKYKLERILKDE